MAAQFLTGAPLLVAGDWLHGHGLLVRDGLIAAILPADAGPAAGRLDLPADTLVAPGLVDLQVNGGGGILFNDDPSPQAALAIAAAHRRLGTTSILPTLITDTPARMRQAAGSICAVAGQGGVAGIHFEGPFLSPERPGVHRPALIRVPEAADLQFLEDLASGMEGRVMLTLAPEMLEDAALSRLAAAGIVLAAGHSAASFERTQGALAAGLTGFTHLFNAMPPPAARAPGIAAAALLDRASWCGVIADGIHVHPAMLRLLLAAKPADRVFLVSDAMPPVGITLDCFELQGRTIFRREGRLATADGILAGADICLADAVRACVALLGLSPARALTLATATPAAFLRLDHRIGRIAPGLKADLLLLGADLDVLGTWCQGVWQGEAGVLPAMAA